MTGIKEHLEKCIIPFWKGLIDQENGGFFGYVSHDLVLDKRAPKSIIAHARYLYTFSLWYQLFKDESLRMYMDHSYRFLKEAFYDQKQGGYIWMVDYQGHPINTTKHVYAQSFVIYALSEYGIAISDQRIVHEAFDLFQLVDQHAYRDHCHYHEQFREDWTPLKNGLLAVHGLNLPYTTNTLLHLLEAYTNLYRAHQDDVLKDRILGLLKGFKDRLYHEDEKLFYMYFDEDRRTKHLGQSYGHDIETCWLIDRTCDVLNIEDPYIRRMTRDVAEYVYQRAMTSRGLLSEVIHGEQIEDRIWWIQAEAMVGFMNHYQKTNDEKYLKAVQDIYQFILNELVDHREGSEWFWGIDDKGNTLNDHGIAEAWKAPYHNGRALVELIKRGYEK